jgi:hypothetical protein
MFEDLAPKQCRYHERVARRVLVYTKADHSRRVDFVTILLADGFLAVFQDSIGENCAYQANSSEMNQIQNAIEAIANHVRPKRFGDSGL